jgi:hypothetical protein
MTPEVTNTETPWIRGLINCDGSIFLNSLKFFFKWLFTVFSITNKES